MNQDLIAMVLVGGRGTRLKNITKQTAKPAVSFGGKYKLIDFVLSNLSHSDIKSVGLVTQYEPLELMRYIGFGSTWDLDINDGGISFLTPFTSINGELWQRGTAHAINQHFRYIEENNAEHVLILSGDHIYKMDYRKMFQFHKEKNSDLTIATFNTDIKEASRFGILEVDADQRVIGFKEKPKKPKTTLASMGVYIFKKAVLQDLLQKMTRKQTDFGKDLIPISILSKYSVFNYQFNGYFRDVGTVEALFQANMDLIDHPEYLKLNDYKDLPVYTKSSDSPPHHIVENRILENSLVGDGNLVFGDIIHSILGSHILIKRNSILKNTIVFNHAVVESDCEIENAIILEHTHISKGTVLKFNQPTIVDKELLDGGEYNG